MQRKERMTCVGGGLLFHTESVGRGGDFPEEVTRGQRGECREGTSNAETRQSIPCRGCMCVCVCVQQCPQARRVQAIRF